MNLQIIIAAIIFFGAMFICQKVAVSARTRLSDDMNLRISETFTRWNMYYSSIIFGLIIVFFAAFYLWPDSGLTIVVVGAIVYTLYILTKLIVNIRKLNAIGAPADYIGKVKLSYAIFILGAICSLAVLVITPYVWF